MTKPAFPLKFTDFRVNFNENSEAIIDQVRDYVIDSLGESSKLMSAIEPDPSIELTDTFTVDMVQYPVSSFRNVVMSSVFDMHLVTPFILEIDRYFKGNVSRPAINVSIGTNDPVQTWHNAIKQVHGMGINPHILQISRVMWGRAIQPLVVGVNGIAMQSSVASMRLKDEIRNRYGVHVVVFDSADPWTFEFCQFVGRPETVAKMNLGAVTPTIEITDESFKVSLTAEYGLALADDAAVIPVTLS